MFIRLFKSNYRIISLLLIGLLIFLYSYWVNLDRPGVTSPLGWYGIWFDQSLYYQQSRSMAQFHLDKSTFQYPIIYPLLGSLLIKIFPKDPFLLVDAVLFLLTITILYKLLEKAFDGQKAIFGIIILFSLNRFIFDFVTPWTTSVTAPLFLIIFLILYTNKFTRKRLVIISVLTGLGGLTRYTDILFFLPLVIGFIFKDNFKSLKSKLVSVVLVGAILLCFIGIFLVLNFALSGSPSGPYIQRNITTFDFDFAPLTIIEKTIGFFFNSYTFHRQIAFYSSSVLASFPIFLFILPFGLVLFNLVRKEQKHMIIVHTFLFSSFILWYVSHITFNGVSPFTLKTLALHYLKPWYGIAVFYTIYIVDKIFLQKTIDIINLKLFISSASLLLLLPFFIQKSQPRLLTNYNWEVSTSVNQAIAWDVLDNNLDTAWSSIRPRKKGDSVFIDLKKEYMISRLQLVDGGVNVVTNFDTFLSTDGKVWQKLSANYTYNQRRSDSWEILGYMKKARFIKLVLNEESPIDPWYIKEIYIFGY